mmetsp:Transcript_60191/g.105492  ORF Transcript_60191/g.105492 Transcript_60191/m.105492 type:complete len:212 (-) Transcript_60191:1005-1640(-)
MSCQLLRSLACPASSTCPKRRPRCSKEWRTATLHRSRRRAAAARRKEAQPCLRRCLPPGMQCLVRSLAKAGLLAGLWMPQQPAPQHPQPLAYSGPEAPFACGKDTTWTSWRWPNPRCFPRLQRWLSSRPRADTASAPAGLEALCLAPDTSCLVKDERRPSAHGKSGASSPRRGAARLAAQGLSHSRARLCAGRSQLLATPWAVGERWREQQ